MPGASVPLLRTAGGWRLGWSHRPWVAFWCTLPSFGNVYDGGNGGGNTTCVPSSGEWWQQRKQCQDNSALPPTQGDLCQACLLPPCSIPGLGLHIGDGHREWPSACSTSSCMKPCLHLPMYHTPTRYATTPTTMGAESTC
jgi:hypothetical protein